MYLDSRQKKQEGFLGPWCLCGDHTSPGMPTCGQCSVLCHQQPNADADWPSLKGLLY